MTWQILLLAQTELQAFAAFIAVALYSLRLSARAEWAMCSAADYC